MFCADRSPRRGSLGGRAVAGSGRSGLVPLQSNSHAPRDRADIDWELSTSAERYRDFFRQAPIGYRFPNGNVRASDYRLLEEHGFEFDASVFPSWRPGHFDNNSAPTTPQYLPDYDLYEIPFTVYSDLVRVPTALSYCRLLGRPFTEVLAGGPQAVIFNMHMHDLVNTSSFDRLSPFSRAIYARNPDGFGILESALSCLSDWDVQFSRTDDLYRELSKE